MAKTPALNAKSIEKLGAARLAELLLEVSASDATLKRRLRFELAGAQSPAEAGLKHLKLRMLELGKTRVPKPAGKDRVVIGWGGSNGRIYADEIDEQHRQSVVHLALEQIADHQADVDSYISLQSDEARRAPRIAAGIAQRLLSAGRAEEALHVLDAVDDDYPPGLAHDWETTRAEVLDALGKNSVAQAFRWSCFERTLAADHLRNFLKRLPDFDDVQAEDRAMAVALAFPEIHVALHFLITWPALAKAALLVEARCAELDGNLYELLTPAAQALEGKYSLAATLLRRAMINHILEYSKSTRYRHAARHLLECQSQDSSFAGRGAWPSHQDYVNELRRVHQRKAAFWTLLPPP